MKARVIHYNGKYYPQKALDFIFFEYWICFKVKHISPCGEFHDTDVVSFEYSSEAIEFIENEFKKHKTKNEKPIVVWSRED